MHAEDDNLQLSKPRPVIGWAGGKHRLLKHLLPLVPKHRLYVEVFGGSLALFLAKAPSDVEVINDINGELVAFYRCCKYHLEALLDELDLVLNSRREFEDFIRQPGLTEIQRAARWFIRNKLSFAGHGRNFTISRTQPHSSRSQRLVAIRSLNARLNHTTVEERAWEKILDSYDQPEAFFFLDPPYLDDGGDCYKGWSEHELARFCQRLPRLKGKWLFTFQDCPQVREHMAGYEVKVIDRARGIANNNGAKKAARYCEVVFTSELPAARRKAA